MCERALTNRDTGKCWVSSHAVTESGRDGVSRNAIPSVLPELDSLDDLG